MAPGQSEYSGTQFEVARRQWGAHFVNGATLVGLLLLVLVYHVGQLVGSPVPASQLPSVLLERADTDFVNAGFDLTPAVTRNARLAALNAPLEAAPFYYSAMEFEEPREPEKIIALLDETLKRNPRHIFARLWRSRMYYWAGRLPEAISEIERVVSLDHGRTAEYMDALVDLARDPRSHAFLLQRIAIGPTWADAFVRRVAATIDDEDFLLALTSKSKTAFRDYVQALADRGDFERAFLIWQASLSEEQLLAFSWPTDPTFSRKTEPSAFGWRLSSDMASREDDGLYVYFNGRSQKTVASQTIMLGGGYAYRLSISMSGKADARGGFFRWTLRCAKSNAVLATMPATALKDQKTSLFVDAPVPEEGCAVQSLILEALPGEYPYPARLTVHGVTIHEVEGAGGTERSVVQPDP